jgi:hypothetical protein
MSLNYTFNITQLEIAPTGSDGYPDVVTRARYNYVGVNENGYSGSFAGATPLPSPSGSFIPFEDLTEEEVVAWLDVVADKPHMQQQIQKQINNQIDPQNVPAPLPWASPSGSGSL